jgi:hypothetical protein
MWLLDANMDVHLTGVLRDLGILSETAGARGWKALSNGQLVAAAVAGGFDCLLTRDRLFGEFASRALRVHQAFAVVLVNLPQRRWLEYRQSFLDAWDICPITPRHGFLVEWPQDHRPQS